MVQLTLQNIFYGFEEKQSPIFKDRDVLSHSYIPQITIHRDDQIRQLALIIAPAVKGAKISNIFLYGPTGTGKTLVTRHVTSELEKANNNIKVLYVNCKMKRVSDTEYRLLAEFTRKLGRNVPATGLPTDEVYRIFYETLSEMKNVILILDEIDNVVKKIGDEILYNLTRINQDLPDTKISIIGISNDISFIETVDPRVKSSLSEEDIIFPPYNAMQLQDILMQRARMGFCDNALENGVVAKCAALAAQEHGDARKALDLLRIAAELAERRNNDKVAIQHIDEAENKLDLDKYVELVRAQPKQSKTVLAAAIKLMEKGDDDIQTGDVFSFYSQLCSKVGLKILTQRRVSDLIAELDMQGIINTQVISKGRYGRTRKIRILLGEPILGKVKQILSDNSLM